MQQAPQRPTRPEINAQIETVDILSSHWLVELVLTTINFYWDKGGKLLNIYAYDAKPITYYNWLLPEQNRPYSVIKQTMVNRFCFYVMFIGL